MSESPFAQLLGFDLGVDWEIWGLIKLGVLLGLGLYIAFSVMIVRQVDLMSRALNGILEGSLKFLAWVYLAATVVVFLLALFIL